MEKVPPGAVMEEAEEILEIAIDVVTVEVDALETEIEIAIEDIEEVAGVSMEDITGNGTNMTSFDLIN